MMDQVGIINTENNQIESIIEIEMQNSDNMLNCMEIADELICDITNGCEWMMGMCMENMDSSEMNTPHFIVMDEKLGYWFVTTIASGYVAQYSLIDDQLIDAYFVGDAPAILAIDIERQIIFCSRMMPMNGMGEMMPNSNSQIIHSLTYSSMGLSESQLSEYEIDSPAPHGLAISDDGHTIYTASNTTDWLYKIHADFGQNYGYPLDPSIGNPPDQVTQRLKPIQCLSIENRLFVTCSAGVWYNPFNGENSVIPGQLQLWDSDNMVLINTIEFGDYTGPWHIKASPIDNIVYVALSGDNLYNTEGLAAVRFNNDTLSLEWMTTDTLFNTLHGVDVSNDGERIYVSGRGDGNIHIFSNSGEYINNIFTGSNSMLGGISIIKKSLPNLGDCNNDNIINIIDIIIVVNFIIGDSSLSPYSQYASDLNLDLIINIIDIIGIINLIIST